MTDKTSHGSGDTKAKEAKNLAQDGVEAMQHGDRDEGKFLVDAAKDLDPAAATEVLKEKPAKEGKSNRITGLEAFRQEVQPLFTFSKRTLFIIPFFGMLCFLFDKRRIEFAAIASFLALFLIKLAQFVGRKYPSAVKEILSITSLVFCTVTATLIGLRLAGGINGKGQPTNTVSHYALRFVSDELSILTALEISTVVFLTLMIAQLVSHTLSWLLRINHRLDHGYERSHLFLGFSLIYLPSKSYYGIIRTFRVSFDPMKLFTILIMKCFCTTTSVFASLSVVMLIFYRTMAQKAGFTLEKDVFVFEVFGIYTFFSIYLNEEAANLFKKLWICIRVQTHKVLALYAAVRNQATERRHLRPPSGQSGYKASCADHRPPEHQSSARQSSRRE
jgi:hypothetical protein